jgi:hypothetical protein
MKLTRILLAIMFFIVYKKSKGHRIGDIFRLSFIIILTHLIEKYYNCSKANLYHKKSVFIEKIINLCPSIKKRKFIPSPFFVSGLLQTISGVLVQKDSNLIF